MGAYKVSEKQRKKPEGMTDEDWNTFQDWKAKRLKENGRGAAPWLKDAIGRQVEIYSARAPKVNGIVRNVDLRFGRIMIEESDGEMVELSMGSIQQVRYSKHE